MDARSPLRLDKTPFGLRFNAAVALWGVKCANTSTLCDLNSSATGNVDEASTAQRETISPQLQVFLAVLVSALVLLVMAIRYAPLIFQYSEQDWEQVATGVVDGSYSWR